MKDRSASMPSCGFEVRNSQAISYTSGRSHQPDHPVCSDIPEGRLQLNEKIEMVTLLLSANSTLMSISRPIVRDAATPCDMNILILPGELLLRENTWYGPGMAAPG